MKAYMNPPITFVKNVTTPAPPSPAAAADIRFLIPDIILNIV